MKTVLRLLLIALPLLSLAAVAGPGKIAGKVSDAKTGEGIPGVNVVIVGTSMGAATNIDGDYTILNVQPGTYELRASAIGYSPVTVKNVKVNIDLTTRTNIPIGQSMVELKDEVVITATRPAVQKDLTASTAVIGADEIDALPVTEVSEVLSLQAGYVDGHLRGGRSGEISYWIDGVPVTDVYDGGMVVEVNKNQVQELQMVSGAFNAEYGQALSGIVNIATKDGDNRFRGSIGTYVGDYVTGNTGVFRGTQTVNPLGIANIDGSLSGPVIGDRIFFVLNGRFNKFDGWLRGVNRFTPSNIAYTDSAGTFIMNRDGASGLGDGKTVAMNNSEKIYGQAKLSFRVFEGVKFWYQYIHDDVTYQDYNPFFVFNPGGNPTNHRIGQTHLAQATHVLSNSTFYTVGFSLFKKDFRRSVYDDKNDRRYVHPNLLEQVTPYSFSTGGVDMGYFNRTTTTMSVKADFTSQFTQQHLIKGGVQVSAHDLYFNNITLRPVEAQTEINLATDSPFIATRILDVSTIYHDTYTRRPQEYSAYLQDKIELDNLIINVGVRFDYFSPDGSILADPTDPSIYNPIKPSNRFHDANGNGVQDAGESAVSHGAGGVLVHESDGQVAVQPALRRRLPHHRPRRAALFLRTFLPDSALRTALHQSVLQARLGHRQPGNRRQCRFETGKNHQRRDRPAAAAHGGHLRRPDRLHPRHARSGRYARGPDHDLRRLGHVFPHREQRFRLHARDRPVVVQAFHRRSRRVARLHLPDRARHGFRSLRGAAGRRARRSSRGAAHRAELGPAPHDQRHGVVQRPVVRRQSDRAVRQRAALHAAPHGRHHLADHQQPGEAERPQHGRAALQEFLARIHDAQPLPARVQHL
ncbi:MAG: carboxypeptidase regulatory-like domain-containing protein [Ignavibacteria bacterium]|nr:carboxypeptidase regulatory-like domain-containing protein [Ignavibacteria bacterium]